jgi:class 3 adenylate cyclase
VIHCRGDRIAPVEHGRYYAQRIPGARCVEFPGEGHWWWTGDDSDAIPQEIEEFLTGQRHDAEIGRVLKTILFTDIVGSTERAAEVGDRRWRDLLDAHDAAIRRVLERFRGEEIRTTGDGFSPRSTGRRGRSTARMRSPRTRAGSGSRSERGCTPVNARYGATTWLVSPCTPVLGLPRWQALARYLSRTRCAISSPARVSSSPTGAGTR